MAAVDKIVGTRAQYWELRDWLHENEPWYRWSIVPEDRYKNDTQRLTISNFSTVEDFYLFHLCPIPWVKARLVEQYGPQGPKALGALPQEGSVK